MNEHKPRKRGLSGRRAILTLALTLALIASAGFLIGFSEESIADASGSCGDDLTYSYTESTKTLTISGEGDMYDYESGHAPWYSYKNDIQTLIINSGVTSVGNYAFINCSGLTGSLALPDSVASTFDIVFEEADNSSITSEQRRAAGNNTVYDVHAAVNGTTITTFDGDVTISMPYVLREGEKPTDVKIYYVSDGGNVELIGGNWSDGYVTATLSHFSDYFAASDYVLNDVILLQTGEGSAGASAYSCVPGTIVKLTATPADGWKFVKWESKQVTVTDGSFTMPDTDVTLKVVFEKESSSGSSLWWVLIVVAAIACIAGGYWFYNSRKA